jgi:arylsulfatase
LEREARRPLVEDIWELYYVPEDSSLVNDLGATNRDKLKVLQDLFMKETEKNHALPIDDRVFERTIASNVGRPDIKGDRTKLSLAERMVGMSENVFINIKNRLKTLTVDAEIPSGHTADLGIDLATPVVERIGAESKSRFNGKIPKLTIEVK